MRLFDWRNSIAVEERFRAVSEAAPYGTIISDVDFNVTHANKAYTEITGLTLEDVTGRGYLQAVHPGDRESLRSRQMTLDPFGGDPLELEHRLLLKDGTVKWARVVVSSIITNDKHVGWVSMLEDVTEKRESRIALADSQETFKAASEASPYGVIVTDTESRASYVNARFLEITGLSIGEALGMGHRDVVHPDDLEWLADEWESHDISTGSFEREHRIKLGDGTVKWVSVIVSPMYHAQELTGYAVSLVDITQKREIDEALIASEERFRVMADCSPIGLILRDESGEVYYANAALKDMTGLDEKDMRGTSWADHIHEDDRDRVREDLERFMREVRNGELGAYQSEHRFNHPDGRVLLLLANVVPLMEGRRISGFLSSIIDMTEIRLSQETLAEIEFRFRTIFENAGDSIVIVTKEGRIETINPHAVEMFGYQPGELIGKPVTVLMPEDLAQMHNSRIDKYVAEQESSVVGNTREVEGLRKNGTQFPLELSVSELSNYHGGFIGVLRDVSERRKMEDLLRTSEERFRVMADSSPLGISIRDVNNTAIYCNRALCDMLNVTLDEMNTREYFQWLHPHDTIRVRASLDQFVRAALSGSDSILKSEHRLIINEKVKWFAVTVVPIHYSSDETSFLSATEDITGRKTSEAAILAAKADAERANRAKSEFLSRMSHELRTPMNAILGFAQLLELDSLHPDQREGVDQILKAGKHLLTLINEVLDITSIEDSSFSIECTALNLGQIVRNSSEMLESLANQASVKITTDPCVDTFGVLADNQRLTQVLLNLISNAIKYNKHGGTVEITAYSDGATTTVRITDTGHGIPEEVIDRLFVPFDRLGAEMTRIEGTGLGLALASRLTIAMNGELHIESELGTGTTATVSLPAAENPAARKSRKRK